MSHGKKVIVVANRLPLTINIVTPSPTPSATPSAGALAPAEGGTGGKGLESLRPEPLETGKCRGKCRGLHILSNTFIRWFGVSIERCDIFGQYMDGMAWL